MRGDPLSARVAACPSATAARTPACGSNAVRRAVCLRIPLAPVHGRLHCFTLLHPDKDPLQHCAPLHAQSASTTGWIRQRRRRCRQQLLQPPDGCVRRRMRGRGRQCCTCCERCQSAPEGGGGARRRGFQPPASVFPVTGGLPCAACAAQSFGCSSDCPHICGTAPWALLPRAKTDVAHRMVAEVGVLQQVLPATNWLSNGKAALRECLRLNREWRPLLRELSNAVAYAGSTWRHQG